MEPLSRSEEQVMAALWACGLVGVALGSGAYVLALAAFAALR